MVTKESQPIEQHSKFPYPGVVDADGHILEPPDLWENYLEEKYKPRAMRIKLDDNGQEYWEIDGKQSRRLNKGKMGFLAAMGEDMSKAKPRTYLEGAPFGSMNARERVQYLDQENLEMAVLYPTIGIFWEFECDDPELTAAYCRAYNRYIVDFCKDGDGRLVPIAHLSLFDPAAAAEELERAVKSGAKGAFVGTFNQTGQSHGHPDHDVLWAKAQELGVPIGIHPTLEPTWAVTSQRFKDLTGRYVWFHNVIARQGSQQAFYSMFQYGVFDKFPGLKLVILESGGGWIASSLDRMDAVFDTMLGRSLPLKEKPSTYFKRQCWISSDPDETALSPIIDLVGDDRFFWASDYPHPDHAPDYVDHLVELVQPLSDRARKNLLGDAVKKAYNLT
jgi:predicted TIM-barrel fold metal-dependent hydrolase